MNFNLFGPRQQGLSMPTVGRTNTPYAAMNSGFQMPEAQIASSAGLQGRNTMWPAQQSLVPNQPGFKAPTGLADQMNAPLQKYAQPSPGMSPLAMMQLMNMGQSLTQAPPPMPLPQPFRSPFTQTQPYAPRWRQSLF